MARCEPTNRLQVIFTNPDGPDAMLLDLGPLYIEILPLSGNLDCNFFGLTPSDSFLRSRCYRIGDRQG